VAIGWRAIESGMKHQPWLAGKWRSSVERWPFAWICVSMAAGILLQRHELAPFWAVIAGGALALPIYRINRLACVCMAVAAPFLFFRAEQATPQRAPESPEIVSGFAVVVPGTLRALYGDCVVRPLEQAQASHPFLLTGQIGEWRVGDVVQFRGSRQALPAARNPGQFDRAAFYLGLGISTEVLLPDPADAVEVGFEAPAPWWQLALWLRERIQKNLTLGVDPGAVETAMMLGIVLGDKRALDPATRQVFRETGTAHLLAVSGMHVAIVAGALLVMTLPLRRHAVWRGALVLAGVWVYCMITAMTPSGMRASIMATVLIAAGCLERRSISANTLFVAAAAIFLVRPSDLFEAGFQLSFTVVLGLIVLTPPLWHWWERRVKHDPFIPTILLSPWERGAERVALWTGGLLAAQCAAWITSTPLTVAYFHMVVPGGMPANLLLSPLSSAMLLAGVASGFAGIVWSGFAWGLNQMSAWLAAISLGIVQHIAGFPGCAIPLVPRDFLPRPEFSLVVADAGSGGLHLLRTGEEIRLIDAGHARELRGLTLPLLSWDGVRKLNALWITHGDAGHAGGARGVMDAHEVEQIGLPETRDRSPVRIAFERSVVETNLSVVRLKAGVHGEWAGETHWEILHPPALHRDRHADNKALAIRLRHRTGNVLLLSDLGFSGLRLLSERHPDLRAEIVIHDGGTGADPVLDPSTILAFEPLLIVLNRGVTHESRSAIRAMADQLRASGVSVWEQETHGAITLASDADSIRATGFMSGASIVIRKR